MKKEEIYMSLFNFSRPTYYKWKRDGIPALKLIEDNFTDEELIVFLQSQNENSNVEFFKKNIKDLLVDNAIYSAKEKYQQYLHGDILDSANNYGAREILKDILKTIDQNEIFMDTAKDFIIERVKGYEAKPLSLKNPQKVKLLSSILKNRFSKIEVYAICKYSDEILDKPVEKQQLQEDIAKASFDEFNKRKANININDSKMAGGHTW